MRRLALLGLAVLAVYFGGQYSMNHWTAWTAETKASVWVAVGTLFLAVATASSVWETRSVVKGEDRRHQQGLAPLLVAGDSLNTREQYERGFTVRNYGSGIALNPHLTVRGSVAVSKISIPPGTRVPDDVYERDKLYERFTAVTHRSFDRVITWSASYAGGWDTFSEEAFGGADGSIYSVTYSHCTIYYNDMFGNRYETRYSDDSLDKFEWIQPPELRVRG